MTRLWRWYAESTLVAKVLIGGGFLCATTIFGLLIMARCLPPYAIKMKMPETYKVELSPRVYSVWSFCIWPSKGINVEDQDPNLVILDERNRRIVSEREKPQWTPPGRVFMPISKNAGRCVDQIRIASKGTYTVSSVKKAVVVLVPEELETLWMDSPDFIGSSDDYNFASSSSKH